MQHKLCLKTLVLFIASLVTFAQAQAQKYVILSKDLRAVNAVLKDDKVSDASNLKYNKAVVASLSAGTIKKLQKKIPGVIIEPDYPAEIAGKVVAGKPAPGGGGSGQVVPWGISAIQAKDAHAYNRGVGVVVCVVDTGIQFSHPDLAGQVIGGENFVPNSRGVIDPLKYDDDHGHGTHVSGTLAALDNGIGVVGVAPEAKLLAVKVLDRSGSGSTSRVAEGIRSCMAKGADIISMSLSVYSETSSEIMHSAIQDAAAMGIVSVAAAGNLGSYIISFPARYPEVFAVSAIDSSYNFASFSNYGAEIDYTAPGVNVYSTTKGGKYGYMEGTSMAAPHVAGTLALQISSGSLGLVGVDIGLPVEQQGLGLINALSTVTNFN